MRLRELRRSKDLTQEELANTLNIQKMTYNGYENGKHEPSIQTLCRLADYYRVSLDYLVGRDRVGDIGYLDEDQRTAVKLIQNLNKNNLLHTISFMQGLYVNQ